jgi:predicted phosphodiesterase
MARARRWVWLGGAALLLLVAGGLLAGKRPMPPYARPSRSIADSSGPIVVLGDTQRTSWAERWIGREQNETARNRVVAKIATEERPALVVHLGDMVTTGADPEDWEYFDRLMSPLTARGLRIRAVLGNHDLWGDDERALGHVRRRFPELTHGGWYALRQRGLGLVWLNSNLDGPAAREQSAWFKTTLDDFDHDANMRGVLVFTHHPPFTNGIGHSADPYVVSELLPPFLRARKTLALLSGHVHGYERFAESGKAFIVSGGAGGPRVEYAVGSEASPVPTYVTPDGRPRAFNYVVIEGRSREVAVTVKCLDVDAVCVGGILERFSLPLPSAPCTGADCSEH